MSYVEASSVRVRPERPELEERMRRLRMLDELRAQSVARMLRVDVELLDPTATENEERTDPAVHFDDPDHLV